MFAPDHVDGTLEQMLLASAPLGIIVSGRSLRIGLYPVALVLLARSWRCSLTFRPNPVGVGGIAAAGTPSLTLIGADRRALTLGVRGASVLMALLVLFTCRF
jgi:heme exporter protein B